MRGTGRCDTHRNSCNPQHPETQKGACHKTSQAQHNESSSRSSCSGETVMTAMMTKKKDSDACSHYIYTDAPTMARVAMRMAT